MDLGLDTLVTAEVQARNGHSPGPEYRQARPRKNTLVEHNHVPNHGQKLKHRSNEAKRAYQRRKGHRKDARFQSQKSPTVNHINIAYTYVQNKLRVTNRIGHNIEDN